ncbi:UDP-N-acetyl glucosamine-2-epimerase [Luteimonas sp. 9C]|uniref:non-hydrolyzing UDP-N-acetylglucosamine 2-epimerase n=1 Tax=Luteimonas sp. 9C TaxID=2653148 RepID=UPI0012F29710|nr:UDP-N-acetylglucosamine 2-epimerase (non-hydrolyzing) [Luteimonas sp. 9C]VXA95084.1 UDP-N-acetyl glucosamine-2-epimerase [Luteimonas sp. 9C]
MSNVKKVMFVFGTRPEAIKMAPVIKAVRQSAGLSAIVVVSAQHRGMLDQVLSFFSIDPDIDLDLMRPDQTLPDLFGRALNGIHRAIGEVGPDLVLVHGDTTTTLAAAMAAFYRQVPVGHVEAGLRTHDMSAPFPEEMNRRLTSPLGSLHFAPTDLSARNLLQEGIPADRIHVTGNTAVDAILQAAAGIDADTMLQARLDAALPPSTGRRGLVLVTSHRRENFGEGFERICRSLQEIAALGLDVIYPVHPNPNIRGPAQRALGHIPGISLIEPLEYLPFVRLMQRADLILTDSGGIQEEAPSLGTPVLLMREATERPEGVASGAIRLVGTDPARIRNAVEHLLDERASPPATPGARNPYGDGKASERIATIITGHLTPPA